MTPERCSTSKAVKNRFQHAILLRQVEINRTPTSNCPSICEINTTTQLSKKKEHRPGPHTVLKEKGTTIWNQEDPEACAIMEDVLGIPSKPPIPIRVTGMQQHGKQLYQMRTMSKQLLGQVQGKWLHIFTVCLFTTWTRTSDLDHFTWKFLPWNLSLGS